VVGKEVRAVAYEANDEGLISFDRSNHLKSQFDLVTMTA
jgi:hypothetical protein